MHYKHNATVTELTEQVATAAVEADAMRMTIGAMSAAADATRGVVTRLDKDSHAPAATNTPPAPAPSVPTTVATKFGTGRVLGRGNNGSYVVQLPYGVAYVTRDVVVGTPEYEAVRNTEMAALRAKAVTATDLASRLAFSEKTMVMAMESSQRTITNLQQKCRAAKAEIVHLKSKMSADATARDAEADDARFQLKNITRRLAELINEKVREHGPVPVCISAILFCPLYTNTQGCALTPSWI